MDEEAQLIEAILGEMASMAFAKGLPSIRCEYNGLHIPVLQEIADNFQLVEGQELSDEVMLAITRAMALYCD